MNPRVSRNFGIQYSLVRNAAPTPLALTGTSVIHVGTRSARIIGSVNPMITVSMNTSTSVRTNARNGVSSANEMSVSSASVAPFTGSAKALVTPGWLASQRTALLIGGTRPKYVARINTKTANNISPPHRVGSLMRVPPGGVPLHGQGQASGGPV